MMFKLAINTLPYNFILFIDNYFIELKLAIKLKALNIIIYRIIKLNRADLLDLLIRIK